MSVTYVSPEEALGVVADRIEEAEVVLDLGPGICPQSYIKPYVHICVDAHRPYLERAKRDVGDDPRYVFINAPWDQVMGMFPDKSVDTVFALDFIEHLEKEDGLRMLREAERVARRQIVIYTPHGFYPQSYDDPQKPDRWGMDGGYWQTHRSGWGMEDFSDSWDFVICPDFHLTDENDETLEEPMGALWAFRNLSAETLPRRYIVIKEEQRHLVMAEDSAWAHFKKTLERGLPTPLFNGLQSTWRGLMRVTHRAPPKNGAGGAG